MCIDLINTGFFSDIVYLKRVTVHLINDAVVRSKMSIDLNRLNRYVIDTPYTTTLQKGE